MGLGGDFMCAAAAREISQCLDKKIYFVSYKSSKRKILRITSPSWSPVFENNPYISKYPSNDSITINRSLKGISYVEKELKDKFIWKKEKHAVEIICDFFQIKPRSIEPEIFYSNSEINWFNGYKKKLPKKYLTIEPMSKLEFTPNRAWAFDNWQKLVQKLKNHYNIIQLGIKTTRPLEGVKLINNVSFRQAGLIIANSEAFLGTVGGLMHLARAVKTKSIILHSGFEPLYCTSYPSNINIFRDYECSPCGLKTKCNLDVKCLNEISYQEVLDTVLRELG